MKSDSELIAEAAKCFREARQRLLRKTITMQKNEAGKATIYNHSGKVIGYQG